MKVQEAKDWSIYRAIDLLKRIKKEETHERYIDRHKAFDIAIESMEKQIPKKPLYRQGTRYKWIDTVRERGRCYNIEKWSNRDACPNCKKDILKTNFCEHCGQKLDWGEGGTSD